MEGSTAWRAAVTSMVFHVGGAGQTFDKVVVGFGPAVSVVGGEDPNWLLVCLEGRVPDLLQLDEDLIGGEGAPIAAVNIQLKELGRRERQRFIAASHAD